MMSILLFFIISHTSTLLAIGANSSLRAEGLLRGSPNPKELSPGLGESCSSKSACNSHTHAKCTNGTCACGAHHPVLHPDKKKCLRSILLGESCTYDIECSHGDPFAECYVYSKEYTECSCVQEYEMKVIHGLKPPKICFPGVKLSQKDIPTFLGFGLALSIMTGLLCLVLKIFARARYSRTRRYANAAIPPPLTVSETYAAFALASARSTPYGRPRSAGSSRRTSCASINNKKGGILRLSSSSSLAQQRQSLSRPPSSNSIRSLQGGYFIPGTAIDRGDHYILYMVRAPVHSITSNSTASTNCDSNSVLELGAVGPSFTTSTFKTLSSEDVFEEEDELRMEREEEEERQSRVDDEDVILELEDNSEDELMIKKDGGAIKKF